MSTEIVLFYYYSAPVLPSTCALRLAPEVAYRNMFLASTGDKVHFEFPMFEDHSYNTICNRIGLRNLIQTPATNKYIIFRTNRDIIGYYRVRRAYYQETKMFNNNGFVWGIESEPYLIARGTVRYEGPPLRQGFKASWHKEWTQRLSSFLERIRQEDDISSLYQAETNRLVRIFQDWEEMARWRQACEHCTGQDNCSLFKEFARYAKKHPGSDMFSAMHAVYRSNLYSRTVLVGTTKVYLK